jgi:hypothetical protein
MHRGCLLNPFCHGIALVYVFVQSMERKANARDVIFYMKNSIPHILQWLTVCQIIFNPLSKICFASKTREVIIWAFYLTFQICVLPIWHAQILQVLWTLIIFAFVVRRSISIYTTAVYIRCLTDHLNCHHFFWPVCFFKKKTLLVGNWNFLAHLSHPFGVQPQSSLIHVASCGYSPCPCALLFLFAVCGINNEIYEIWWNALQWDAL